MSINMSPYSNAFLPAYSTSDHTDQTSALETPVLSRNKRGVAGQSALWPQHSTLKISMTGMTDEQKKFTKDNINKWAPHVNLKFDFTDEPGADIRISAGENSWSGLGTESKRQNPDKPTMLVRLKDGMNTESAGTILHEFGHALGLIHEHQHPQTPLSFNFSQISQSQHGQLDANEFEHNFQPITTDVVTSAYDQKSIMHYGIQASWLNEGTSIESNSQLSRGDISFIRRLYPPVIRKPIASNWWDYRGLDRRS